MSSGARDFVFPPIPATRRPVLRDILDSWVDRKYVLDPHLWELPPGLRPRSTGRPVTASGLAESAVDDVGGAL